MEEIKIPETEIMDLKELKVDGDNPNKMNQMQRDALWENMQRYGVIVPIITNKEKVVADGQNRLEVLLEHGVTKGPVIRLNIEDVDRRILRQVLNKLKGQHDVMRDADEYEKILKQATIEELADLMGADGKYIKDVLDARKEFPEEYLEMQQVRANIPEDNARIIKLVLTKEQKEKIVKKLGEDGKRMYQIIDYFVVVEE